MASGRYDNLKLLQMLLLWYAQADLAYTLYMRVVASVVYGVVWRLQGFHTTVLAPAQPAGHER